jgi:hypothetical protein
MRGETHHRDIAVSSCTLIHHTPILAKSAIVTEDGWCLHYSGSYQEIERDAAIWLVKLVDPDTAQLPAAPALYHLPTDPHEEHDVISSNEGLAREIHARYVKWLEAAGTPGEHLAGRRSMR